MECSKWLPIGQVKFAVWEAYLCTFFTFMLFLILRKQEVMPTVTVPTPPSGSSDHLLEVPVALRLPADSALSYTLELDSLTDSLSICDVKITRRGSAYICEPRLFNKIRSKDGKTFTVGVSGLTTNGKYYYQICFSIIIVIIITNKK